MLASDWPGRLAWRSDALAGSWIHVSVQYRNWSVTRSVFGRSDLEIMENLEMFVAAGAGLILDEESRQLDGGTADGLLPFDGTVQASQWRKIAVEGSMDIRPFMCSPGMKGISVVRVTASLRFTVGRL